VRAGYNAGVSTRNFSVVDIDDCSLIERFEKKYQPVITTIIATPRGGRHYYFSGTTCNQQRDRWDVRGVGGYVVAAGSSVGGKPYRALTEIVSIADLKPLPTELLKPRSVQKCDGECDLFRRINRAKAFAATVRCIERQRAHDTLFRLVCWMRDVAGINRTEAYAILLDWNQTNCFREDGVTPFPWKMHEMTHKLQDVFR
jgi:hypothetical protein